MEARALLNFFVRYDPNVNKHISNDLSAWQGDSNGFFPDDVNGLVYLPKRITNGVAPVQFMSSDNVIEKTVMSQVTLARLLYFTRLFTPKGIILEFCDIDSPLFAESYFLRLYYGVSNLIDVNTPKPYPKPSLTEQPLSSLCLNGSCDKFQTLRVSRGKSASRIENLSKCHKTLSIIVGFKTALDVCEREGTNE